MFFKNCLNNCDNNEKDRGSITMTALMAMLVFSIYGIALYGRSVSIYTIQEKQIKSIQNLYSGDIDRAYEIAQNLPE